MLPAFLLCAKCISILILSESDGCPFGSKVVFYTSPPLYLDGQCVCTNLSFPYYVPHLFISFSLESHKRKPSKTSVARVVKNWVNKYQVRRRGVKLDRDRENSLTLYLNIRRRTGAEEHLLLFWEKEIKLLFLDFSNV